MPKRRRKSRTPRQKYITELDQAFSRFIRERDKRCQRCGTDTAPNCAHIFTRRALSTRWDPQNALQLCVGCHFWNHQNPLDFYDWIQERMGEQQFKALRLRSKLPVKYTTHDLALFWEKVKQEGF